MLRVKVNLSERKVSVIRYRMNGEFVERKECLGPDGKWVEIPELGELVWISDEVVFGPPIYSKGDEKVV